MVNLGKGKGGGADGEGAKDPAVAGGANDEVDVKDADGLAGKVCLWQIIGGAGEDGGWEDGNGRNEL